MMEVQPPSPESTSSSSMMLVAQRVRFGFSQGSAVSACLILKQQQATWSVSQKALSWSRLALQLLSA